MFNPLGNGYCRSEAAVAVLITKKSMAKRIYATVLNAGNNTDGYKEQGKLILPSHRRQIYLKSSSMCEISSVNTFLLALEAWHYYKSWHYMCRRCRSLSPSASCHTLHTSVFKHDTWLSVRTQGIWNLWHTPDIRPPLVPVVLLHWGQKNPCCSSRVRSRKTYVIAATCKSAHILECGMSPLSSGVTFPSGEMQQRLVRSLYQDANISPEQVEYIEAHGTGTKVSHYEITRMHPFRRDLLWK